MVELDSFRFTARDAGRNVYFVIGAGFTDVLQRLEEKNDTLDSDSQCIEINIRRLEKESYLLNVNEIDEQV